jgi:transposase
VRKRLLVVKAILAGESVEQAARTVKVTPETVDRCLVRIRQSGLSSLLIDKRPGRSKHPSKPEEVDLARREIAAALKRRPERRVRRRLLAIDAVLSGKTVEEAAALALVRVSTVRDWLRLVGRDGIVETLERWENRPGPRRLEADAMELRELAAKEVNPRIRRRMLALASVADGMSLYDAAASTGLEPCAISKRIRRFHEEGIPAFYDTFCRPTKLTGAQLQELRAQILERPDMSYRDLQDLVQTRFGVPYSVAGLRLLLKKELGIVRSKGRFGETEAGSKRGKAQGQHATVEALSVARVNEGLNLAELQASLSKATDQRMKDRLKALIEVGQGGGVKAVAQTNGVHPDTLRKWLSCYRSEGIESLRSKGSERGGRPPKLSGEEHHLLIEKIRAEPGMDERDLCAWVQDRFGVIYSPFTMVRFTREARKVSPPVGSRQ